ncbi:type VII secretion target [Nocardia sp. CA-107356]|uniref:type VII secretion target n=1 Tax=Nocardia sp. CA-107356 TaxID=3239972 RepID=UPI003D94C314
MMYYAWSKTMGKLDESNGGRSMEKLSVDTTNVAVFGKFAHTMATETAAAGDAVAGAAPAQLRSTFGLIGDDFLAALSAVHAEHTADIRKLSKAYTRIGGIATTAAADYIDTERVGADALRALGERARQ